MDKIELAGERITVERDANGDDVIRFGDKGTGRLCGSCSLCCKLLPVPGPPLHKAAGVRCKHVKVGDRKSVV